MSFSLQSDRVAVIAEPLETKTASGLHVPETFETNKPRYGEVAVVGIGHRSEHNGELVPMDVKVGDHVFFHRQSGETWEFEGTEYTVLAPREIIGVAHEA